MARTRSPPAQVCRAVLHGINPCPPLRLSQNPPVVNSNDLPTGRSPILQPQPCKAVSRELKFAVYLKPDERPRKRVLLVRLYRHGKGRVWEVGLKQRRRLARSRPRLFLLLFPHRFDCGYPPLRLSILSRLESLGSCCCRQRNEPPPPIKKGSREKGTKKFVHQPGASVRALKLCRSGNNDKMPPNPGGRHWPGFKGAYGVSLSVAR